MKYALLTALAIFIVLVTIIFDQDRYIDRLHGAAESTQENHR